jgi:hypothetical protein
MLACITFSGSAELFDVEPDLEGFGLLP